MPGVRGRLWHTIHARNDDQLGRRDPLDADRPVPPNLPPAAASDPCRPDLENRDPALAPLLDRQAWIEANLPWRALSCGHRHRVPLDRRDEHWGAGIVGRTYRVTADLPVHRALDGRDENPRTTIPAGSRIRCDAWSGYSRGAEFWHIFRCQVLDGPQAGTCCLIDDPSQPDQVGWVFHPPALPPACVPEE